MTGVLYIYFVGNLLLFPPVKEFLKSVKNGQSYRHKFGVLLFFGTPCSMVWLPDGEKTLMICSAVSAEYRRVTDGRTDIFPLHSLRYAHASRGKN